ncbi:MAG: transcriptional regulator with XRE-family HTH domain [bacterium]|jgi:transcriptional regulator with XRE-family HTH domain
MSFFGKNIKKIRGVKRLSQQAFADIFLLKRATLGAYEEGRSEPKIDTIIKVANYFSISIDLILTKEITVNQLLRFDGGVTTDVNQVVKVGLVEVPFVSELNCEAFVYNFIKSETYELLPRISIPVEKKNDMLAFVIQDLMMVSNEEGLFPGDVVIGERVRIDNIEEGEVVMVLVNETIFVRRFSKTGSTYLLLADHINISPLLIDCDTTIFFWKVSEVLLKRYPNFTSRLEDRINQIDAKLKKLSTK